MRAKGTKRISGQTLANVEREFRAGIDSIFYSLLATREPLAKASADWTALQDRLGWSRLPMNAREALAAYYHGQWHSMWRFADWRVYWRGAYYYKPYREHATYWYARTMGHGTARPDSEILDGTWNEIDMEKSAHFWLDSDRPF